MPEMTTAGIRFGVSFDGFAPVRDAVALACEAEAAGASSFWIADHVGYRDTLVTATAIAGATTTLRVVPIHESSAPTTGPVHGAAMIELTRPKRNAPRKPTPPTVERRFCSEGGRFSSNAPNIDAASARKAHAATRRKRGRMLMASAGARRRGRGALRNLRSVVVFGSATSGVYSLCWSSSHV